MSPAAARRVVGLSVSRPRYLRVPPHGVAGDASQNRRARGRGRAATRPRMIQLLLEANNSLARRLARAALAAVRFTHVVQFERLVVAPESRAPVSTKLPRLDSASRNGHVPAAAAARLGFAEWSRPSRGGGATRFHGMFASQPRRRRDSASRNIHVPGAAAARLGFTEYSRPRGGGGVIHGMSARRTHSKYHTSSPLS